MLTFVSRASVQLPFVRCSWFLVFMVNGGEIAVGLSSLGWHWPAPRFSFPPPSVFFFFFWFCLNFCNLFECRGWTRATLNLHA